MYQSSNFLSENSQNYHPLPFKVKSTASSAFSDPFNWSMIIAAVVLVSAFMAIFIFTPHWGTFIFAFLPVAFSVWFLYRYFRAILNREIEVTDTGIKYQEASRKLFFSWDNIEIISLQPSLGQITFLANGSINRIHEFGLSGQDRKTVREIIAQQAELRQIKVEGLIE